MTHQNLSLGMCWKLFWATLRWQVSCSRKDSVIFSKSIEYIPFATLFCHNFPLYHLQDTSRSENDYGVKIGRDLVQSLYDYVKKAQGPREGDCHIKMTGVLSLKMFTARTFAIPFRVLGQNKHDRGENIRVIFKISNEHSHPLKMAPWGPCPPAELLSCLIKENTITANSIGNLHICLDFSKRCRVWSKTFSPACRR